MRFAPKSEKEVQRGTLLAPGIYDFDVIKSDDEVSSSGNEMIHLTLKLYGPEGTTIIHDYLLEKVAYKLRHGAYAVGIGDRYETGVIVAADFMERSGKVEVRIAEDKSGKYPPKNEVKDYIVPDGYREARDEADNAKIKQEVAEKKRSAISKADAGTPLNDEDIPF